MKRKVIFYILIFIIILLSVFLLFNLRKAIIINKLSEKVRETQELTNYYYKSEAADAITTVYRKDDKSLFKYETDNNIRQIYINGNELWILNDEKNGKKTANKIDATEFLFMPLMDGSLCTENLWQSLLIAIQAKITSEDVDGKECYKIYLDEDFQIFVNKTDFIKIKEINCDKTTKLLEYSIGTVTDSDLEIMNVLGYEVEEN